MTLRVLPPRVPVGRFRPMCAVLLPIIVQCVNNSVRRRGMRRVRRFEGMRGGSVVGLTVQHVQPCKMNVKLYD